jgi:acyl dehydratase
VDAEWCKTQPFGQRIAHGTLIFSVAVGMTADAVNPRAISYGYDRLRLRPVYHGDNRVHVTIREKGPPKRAGHGIVAEACGGVEPAGRDRVGV